MREEATRTHYTKAGVEADAAKKRKQFDIGRHGYIQIITQQGMKGDQWVIFATAHQA